MENPTAPSTRALTEKQKRSVVGALIAIAGLIGAIVIALAGRRFKKDNEQFVASGYANLPADNQSVPLSQLPNRQEAFDMADAYCMSMQSAWDKSYFEWSGYINTLPPKALALLAPVGNVGWSTTLIPEGESCLQTDRGTFERRRDKNKRPGSQAARTLQAQIHAMIVQDVAEIDAALKSSKVPCEIKFNPQNG